MLPWLYYLDIEGPHRRIASRFAAFKTKCRNRAFVPLRDIFCGTSLLLKTGRLSWQPVYQNSF